VAGITHDKSTTIDFPGFLYIFTSLAGIMDDKPTPNFAFSHGLCMAIKQGGVRYWFSRLSIYRASRVGYF